MKSGPKIEPIRIEATREPSRTEPVTIEPIRIEPVMIEPIMIEAIRIGVVSDTHMPRFARQIPRALREGLLGSPVDLILHLGDFTGPEVPAQFEALGPFDAVAGNNDPPELHDRFGTRKVIEVGGMQIGLLHGHAIRRGERSLRTPDRAKAAFGGQGLDAVLFGHSHIPFCDRVDGTWFINPGSPTEKRRSACYSYVILEIRDGHLRPELRTYADKSAT